MDNIEEQALKMNDRGDELISLSGCILVILIIFEFTGVTEIGVKDQILRGLDQLLGIWF